MCDRLHNPRKYKNAKPNRGKPESESDDVISLGAEADSNYGHIKLLM